MKNTIEKTKFQLFKNTIILYKSHNLKNNFISITYAYKIDKDTVTTQNTVKTEKRGSAIKSFFLHLTENN